MAQSTSHDPLRWNFSESTSLSEVLIIARKGYPDSPPSVKPLLSVNLWRNPTTAFEAFALAHTVNESREIGDNSELETRDLMVGNRRGPMILGVIKPGAAFLICAAIWPKRNDDGCEEHKRTTDADGRRKDVAERQKEIFE